MERKEQNQAHLNGYIKQGSVNVRKEDGVAFATIFVGTSENYSKKDSEEKESKHTVHRVHISDIPTDIANKLSDAINDKEKTHFISLDGRLMATEKDGKPTFYIAAHADSVKVDEGMQKGESRNTITLEGNVSSLRMYDDFAAVGVALNYAIPGKSVDYKGVEREYTIKTNFLEVRVNKNRLPKTFEQLEKGEIAVGDKIVTRGQMHNDIYEKENDKIFAVKIDANLMKLEAKKAEKKAEVEEKKEEPKKKKAEPKKSRGVKM